MRPHRLAPVVGIVSAALVAVAGLPACDEQAAMMDPGSGAARPTNLADQSPDGPEPTQVSPIDAGAAAPSGALADPEMERDLMARWNAVATTGGQPFDLQWIVFEQFPHPTCKGGSAPAYRAFAAVLLTFFQTGDNFDFLARNHLFTLHLVYFFPSTTFQALAAYFASPDGFGDIPLEVRTALQGIGDRIQAAEVADGADYATMCRHYCDTLYETDLYACVGRSGDATACAQITPTSDQCYELRCVPRRVEPSLCLTQCDGLQAAYDALCASGTGPADLCATPPDAPACRAGCAGPS